MLLAITIATFLGALVVAVVMFFLLAGREQPEEAGTEQRSETRIPMQVGLGIASLVEPVSYEQASTENVSHHGARVIAEKPRPPDERVLVRFSEAGLFRARIAYCNASPENGFAIGLQFSLMVHHFVVPRATIPTEKFPSHTYRK
jgi:hypothetical protein